MCEYTVFNLVTKFEQIFVNGINRGINRVYFFTGMGLQCKLFLESLIGRPKESHFIENK